MATQAKEAVKAKPLDRSTFVPCDLDPEAYPQYYRFPDAPPRLDMQNYVHLHKYAYGTAIEMFLIETLGLDPESIVVISEAYLAWNTYQRGSKLVPDLLIAFNANMPGVIERNGYAIDEQGKPPEFVLEIASKSTGSRDDTVKRVGYANFGVQEYWRFDPSGGERHQTHLAGDRLVNGEYQPIEITKVGDENYRGYSEVLRLELRWEQGQEEGQLRWYDPASRRYLQSYREEVEAHAAAEERAEFAETRAQTAETRAQTAEAERRQEQEARQAAEARNQELQAELERLRRQS